MHKMLMALAVLLNIILPTSAQIRKINIGDTVVFRDEETILDYSGKATTIGKGTPTVGIVTDISTNSDDPNAPLQYFIDYRENKFDNTATVPITNTKICKLSDYKSIADLGKIELPKLSAKEIANIAKHNNSYKVLVDKTPENTKNVVSSLKITQQVPADIKDGKARPEPFGEYLADKMFPKRTITSDGYYVKRISYGKNLIKTFRGSGFVISCFRHLPGQFSDLSYTSYVAYPNDNNTPENTVLDEQCDLVIRAAVLNDGSTGISIYQDPQASRDYAIGGSQIKMARLLAEKLIVYSPRTSKSLFGGKVTPREIATDIEYPAGSFGDADSIKVGLRSDNESTVVTAYTHIYR